MLENLVCFNFTEFRIEFRILSLLEEMFRRVQKPLVISFY